MEQDNSQSLTQVEETDTDYGQDTGHPTQPAQPTGVVSHLRRLFCGNENSGPRIQYNPRIVVLIRAFSSSSSSPSNQFYFGCFLDRLRRPWQRIHFEQESSN